MRDSTGDPKFPVWLVADSAPRNWHRLLLIPLDPRHPARHNIWTSVLECMQDTLYRRERRRFDTKRLYIRNVITNPDDKPESVRLNWAEELEARTNSLRVNLLRFKPKVVLTFGSFAFEFLRRACGEKPKFPHSHWSTAQLGIEFRKRTSSYDASAINIFPLLHVSIARGRFLESHRYFVGGEGNESPNYFEFVGTKLAELFLRKLVLEPIWIE